mgnify:CR=1 FL=1
MYLENFVIRGGHELFGEVNISGAKNAAVAIIPAAILANDVVRIENIPNISDVSLMIQTLDRMGAKIKLINNNTIEIDSRIINALHTTDLNQVYDSIFPPSTVKVPNTCETINKAL